MPGTSAIPNLESTVVSIKKGLPEKEQAAWQFVLWLTSAEVMRKVYPQNSLCVLRDSVAAELRSEDAKVFCDQVKRMAFQRPSPCGDRAFIEAMSERLAMVLQP